MRIPCPSGEGKGLLTTLARFVKLGEKLKQLLRPGDANAASSSALPVAAMIAEAAGRRGASR